MYNLVVSTGRRREGLCMDELRRVGDYLGVKVVNTWFTGFDGLVVAQVDVNPIEFTNKLKELVLSRRYIPRFILKVVPILRVVDTEFEIIVEEAVKLGNELISRDETYRIDVRKRGVYAEKFNRMYIIDAIASKIDRKVRLENPDKILHLDIFPSRTGISVFRESDVFSLLKLQL